MTGIGRQIRPQVPTTIGQATPEALAPVSLNTNQNFIMYVIRQFFFRKYNMQMQHINFSGKRYMMEQVKWYEQLIIPMSTQIKQTLTIHNPISTQIKQILVTHNPTFLFYDGIFIAFRQYYSR